MDVFCTSPWVPAEWIEAHGFRARGVWLSMGGEPAAVREGACAFAQEAATFARNQTGALAVFTTSCDQLRRAADSIASGRASSIFLFNLPATWQTPAARRLYEAEVVRLGRFLESAGAHVPSDAELEATMQRFDQQRSALQSMLGQSSARSGVEALTKFLGGGLATGEHTPGSAGCPPAVRLTVDRRGSEVARASQIGDLEYGRPAVCAASRVPLALIGGPLLPAQWALFETIEAAGGRVVLNATEPGERSLLPPFSPNRTGPPFARLVRHYFDHAVDVFHRPDTRLYDWLRARLASRDVRGVVLWVQVGCDLWRAQAASLREAFGLPLLVLDSVEGHAGGPRDLNRLAAFVESLQ